MWPSFESTSNYEVTRSQFERSQRQEKRWEVLSQLFLKARDKAREETIVEMMRN